MAPLAFMQSVRAMAIFTGLATVEFVSDQLPATASRTAPAGLSARIITGALTLAGASLGLGRRSNALGVALTAAVGGIAGAFAGPTFPRTGFSDRHSRGPGRNRAGAPFGLSILKWQAWGEDPTLYCSGCG
jgi:uncharacterized membrane protein